VKDEAFDKLDLSADLPTITLPTLVLHGKYDMSVPYPVGVSYYDNISSTEKEIISFETSGHQLYQTEPDLFATAVLNFIALYK